MPQMTKNHRDDEHRNNVETIVSGFRGRALDLTLRNPLLKLPDPTSSQRFINIPTESVTRVVQAVHEGRRTLWISPADAGPIETELVTRSFREKVGPIRPQVSESSAKLEASLSVLRKNNEDLIEKRGTPCCFLTAFVLQWITDDGAVCNAPIFLIPIDLIDELDPLLRQRRVSFQSADRDVVVNPVLLEMLKSKFSMEFADLDDYDFDNVASMREWLADTKDAWADRKGWSIAESAVVGLFDCGAIAADCDPNAWVDGIGNSATLQRVLLGSGVPTTSELKPVFLPDHLVLEADGSQLHTLQMAGRGSDLVIHGPPGSGKSQTIVNLIAQALGQGKTVLFVAQKPEAAMVVHRRLKAVNLAPFCTLLIPAGTKASLKQSVIDGLRARLSRRNSTPDANQRARMRLEKAVELLDSTALALGRALPQFGQRAREVVAELALLRQRQTKKLSKTSVVEPSTLRQFEDAIHALESISDQRQAIPDSIFEKLGGIGSSERIDNPNEAAARLRGLVIDAKAGLKEVQSALDRLAAINYAAPHSDSQRLSEWLTEAPTLAPTSDRELVQIATRLHRPGAAEALARLMKRKESQRKILDRQPDAKRRSPTLVEPERSAWSDAASRLRGTPVEPKTIDEASLFRDRLSAFITAMDGILATGPRTAASDAVSEAPDFDAWQNRMSLISRISPTAADVATLTDCFPFTEPPADQVIELASALEALRESEQRATELTFIDRIPQLRELQEFVMTIRRYGGIFGGILGTVFSREYRASKRAMRCMISGDARRRKWDAAINAALIYRQAQTHFDDRLRRHRANVSQDCTSIQLLQAGHLLAELHAVAKHGVLTDKEFWRLLRQSGNSDINKKHRELHQWATRLNRESDTLRTILELAGVDEFSFIRVQRSVERHLQAVDLTLKQAVTWRCEGTTTTKHVVSTAEAASEILELEQECSSDSDLRALLSDARHGLDSDPTQIERAQAWYALAAAGNSRQWNDRICKLLSNAESSQTHIDVHRECISSMVSSLAALRESTDQINASFEFIAPADQYRPTNETNTLALNTKLSCLEENFAYLPELFRFRISARKAELVAGAGIIGKLTAGDIKADKLVDSYKVTVYERAIRESEALNPLSDFDRTAIDQAVDRLAELDSEIRQVNADILADQIRRRPVPQGESLGLVRAKTELGLIAHVLGTPKARIDLHALYRRAGRAIVQLQPCTIATPTAISEYLPRTVGAFDVVIIDEASQVEPASAIGATGRGKQFIVVGDQKQLPPTNFFGGVTVSGVAGNVPDGDGAQDDDAESILDKAVATLPAVMLSGHYRSRHHSLINFSNVHFYNSQLVVAPSRTPRSDKYGIISHHVKDATYAVGTNEIEAIAIAKHAMDQLRRNPEESIGIVAFNVKQAALIETHLESLAKRTPEAFRAYARAKEMEFPLFIRSLESVQGDERDVMLISYTYGPDPASKVVAQRFGPVQREGGGRRLNVMVTRAKNRVEVFHSILPEDISSNTGGAPIMRAYLSYAMQAPDQDFTHGEFESPFEAEVARAIKLIDPSLIVRPQVGCAGFRIDLGIAPSHSPDRFILGIECDGATYHSERSARQRDMVRQQILEHHNWKIYRIWSTAWWHNPEKELELLAKAIQDAAKSGLVG
jgi:hypothetical protein